MKRILAFSGAICLIVAGYLDYLWITTPGVQILICVVAGIATGIGVFLGFLALMEAREDKTRDDYMMMHTALEEKEE